MTYRLDMDGETRVLISHMAPVQKQKVKQALRAIAGNPSEGKPLQEQLYGLLSYRTGTLRVIYSVDKSKKVVHVVAIGPRRTVYEDLERVLGRKP